MNEQNQWQGLFKELAYSVIYVGNEALYVASMLVELTWEDVLKILMELISMPGEVVAELLGEVAPDMDFDFDEITDKDIACRRYGPNMVRIPK